MDRTEALIMWVTPVHYAFQFHAEKEAGSRASFMGGARGGAI